MAQSSTPDPDELAVIGGDSESAARPAVEEFMQRQEKESKRKRDRVLTQVHDVSTKKPIKTYRYLLAELLGKRMKMVEFPDGWQYKTYDTETGVVLDMRYMGRLFRAGFRPTGIAFYDLNAIDTYALRAENTIERVMKEAGADTE